MEKKHFNVGKILVRVFPNRNEMGKSAADDIAERINRIIRSRGEANVVFASAPSQNEMLENLKNKEVDWKKVRAFHMDEYINLREDHPAGFGNFLDRALYKFVTFKECHYMRGGGPEETVKRYTQLMEKYPPDLVILGIGENAHLAFNDPPVADFNDPLLVKLVELDEPCRKQQVNDGAFAHIDEVPKTAITLTIPCLLKIPEKVAIVPGPRKADAIFNTLTGPISTACPASILRNHQSTIYLDVDSAAKVDKLSG